MDKNWLIARPMNKSKLLNTKNHLNHLKLALMVGSLALPLITQAEQPPPKQHSRSQLIDLGTLGGPKYYEDFSGMPPRLLNEQGTVVGGMDTSVPDPACFNPDCLVSHAFQWQNGQLSDLGTLAFNAAGNFSQAFWINDRGLSVGISTDAGLDQVRDSSFQGCPLEEPSNYRSWNPGRKMEHGASNQ